MTGSQSYIIWRPQTTRNTGKTKKSFDSETNIGKLLLVQ